MDEFAVDPLLAVVPNALYGFDPLDVGPKPCDGFVVFVEDRQSGVKFRNKKQVLPGVDVGRPARGRPP